jgi:hypothetical protein
MMCGVLEREKFVEHLSEDTVQEEDARAWVATLIKSVSRGDLVRAVVMM